MPLPLGSWNITANGTPGTLSVSSDGMGGINGSVFGQPLVGFFDETSRTFTFLRITTPDISTFQVYSGALFQFSSSALNTLTYTLAGNFEEFPTNGAISQFGWFAQMTQKLKEKDKEASKETKDSKDSKDHKDNKEGFKEKEVVKEHLKEKELEQVPTTLPEVTGTLGMLMQRVNSLEQRLATGQAFIQPEARPPVGGPALQQSEGGEHTSG